MGATASASISITRVAPGVRTGYRHAAADRSRGRHATAYRAGVESVRPRYQYPWRNAALFALPTAVLLILWLKGWADYAIQPDRSLFAVDFVLYRDAAARWLSGGGFYLPHQLAGPYEVTPGDVLYPPFAIPLFAVFTFLPAALWWIVPIGGTSAIVAWHRPQPKAWPLMALCLWFPATNVKILTGNPVLWAMLAVALGTIWRWPAVLALLKPSLLPFALLGIWRRSWWYALLGVGVVGLVFGPLWPEYLSVLANSRQTSGVLYSLQEVPMMAIPLVAWFGGRERPGAESAA